MHPSLEKFGDRAAHADQIVLITGCSAGTGRTMTVEFARDLVAIVARKRFPVVVQLGNGSWSFPAFSR
jgi:hypothetical protein